MDPKEPDAPTRRVSRRASAHPPTACACRPPFAATSRPDLDPLPNHAAAFPKPSEISAALAALGVYAQVPSERELAEHAIAAGGERVLAAALANALYGAAIGCGMLAEGHMLEQGENRAERLSLARAQALQALPPCSRESPSTRGLKRSRPGAEASRQRREQPSSTNPGRCGNAMRRPRLAANACLGRPCP